MRRWATIPILFLTILLLAPAAVLGQGVTSATIQGTVVDRDDKTLPGANVVAVHEPTGSRYGTTTNERGSFTIANVRVGGPYTITVSFVGYQSKRETGIQLDLGETRSFEFQLREQTEQMDEVEIVAETGAVFNGERRGISTSISATDVQNTPTLSRSIADFARLTPQAAVGNDNDDGATISIAGQNNRYNSVFIDGAVSNDVFGLSGTGLDGGQAGATPISLDAIKQFNIEVSPQPFEGGFSEFQGRAIQSEADLNELLSFIDNTVGNRYDPGSYTGQTTTVDSDKFFGKIDWNINQDHRLSARYNYSETTNIDASEGRPFASAA